MASRRRDSPSSMKTMDVAVHAGGIRRGQLWHATANGDVMQRNSDRGLAFCRLRQLRFCLMVLIPHSRPLDTIFQMTTSVTCNSWPSSMISVFAFWRVEPPGRPKKATAHSGTGNDLFETSQA